MKEQFVSYKIALKLKELEFDEVCFAHYCNGDLITKTAILKSSTMQYYQQNNINPSNQYKGKKCAAPLWQQVIDWFREKHKINIIIMPCVIPSNEIKYYINIIIMPYVIPSNEIKYYIFNGKLKRDWKELYNTYEEAREQAILKAIELIK